MRQLSLSSLLYVLLPLFIAGWWTAAFYQDPSLSKLASPSSTARLTKDGLALSTNTLLDALSPFQRETIHKALAGNFDLMATLIEQWEFDAQYLTCQGVPRIQQLPAEEVVKARLLSSLLASSTGETVRLLNKKMSLKEIQDDSGHLLKPANSYHRFLPQTYVAASFLLAIASPEEIIALPKGVRHLPSLYSPALIEAINHNIESLSGEKLFLAKPDIAFVAPYSHPPALEALRSYGIDLCTLKGSNNLENIQESLLKVGHITHHILEAQLLSIFIDACFTAIDNRLEALHASANQQQNLKNFLYLSYRHHFMLPSAHSSSGQLITRMLEHYPNLSCLIARDTNQWNIPFEQEKILSYNPDCLLVSMPHCTHHPLAPGHQQALHQISAFQNNRIFFIDETIQDSPTQYIALAYFDLYDALVKAHYL